MEAFCHELFNFYGDLVKCFGSISNNNKIADVFLCSAELLFRGSKWASGWISLQLMELLIRTYLVVVALWLGEICPYCAFVILLVGKVTNRTTKKKKSNGYNCKNRTLTRLRCSVRCSRLKRNNISNNTRLTTLLCNEIW